jgi:mannose/fructose/N-acetylgalactosamine-specific phosphotransferase system component IIC
MSWVTLGLIGGVVGLDATSFPQVMLSRPIVAGTAAGLAFGRPGAGLLVGAFVEIFSLVILPFGAARYPESGTATAAAAAAYASVEPAGAAEPILLLAVVFALAWEQVAGASVIFVRRLNERLVPNTGAAFDHRQVTTRHLLAMMIDFIRGVWAVVLGAVTGIALLRVFSSILPTNPQVSVGIIVIGGAAMLGAALPLFGGLRQRWLSLTLGIVCGVILLLWR